MTTAITNSISLSPELNKQLNDAWKEMKFDSRSALIQAAISEFISGVICENCGTRNPAGGHICSVCMRPLTEGDSVKLTVSILQKQKDEIDEDYFNNQQ